MNAITKSNPSNALASICIAVLLTVFGCSSSTGAASGTTAQPATEPNGEEASEVSASGVPKVQGVPAGFTAGSGDTDSDANAIATRSARAHVAMTGTIESLGAEQMWVVRGRSGDWEVNSFIPIKFVIDGQLLMRSNLDHTLFGDEGAITEETAPGAVVEILFGPRRVWYVDTVGNYLAKWEYANLENTVPDSLAAGKSVLMFASRGPTVDASVDPDAPLAYGWTGDFPLDGGLVQDYPDDGSLTEWIELAKAEGRIRLYEGERRVPPPADDVETQPRCGFDGSPCDAK